jgi:hypothetical protein
MMLAIGLSQIAFIMLRFIPSVPIIFRDHEGMLNFVKGFSTSIEMPMWFLSFILLMSCITFIDFICWTILAALEWNQLVHSVWLLAC